MKRRTFFGSFRSAGDGGNRTAFWLAMVGLTFALVLGFLIFRWIFRHITDF